MLHVIVGGVSPTQAGTVGGCAAPSLAGLICAKVRRAGCRATEWVCACDHSIVDADRVVDSDPMLGSLH